jgi:hypothetical protein
MEKSLLNQSLMKTLIFALLLISSISVSAQGKLSITGGASISNVKDDNSYIDRTRVGYYAGLSLRVPVNSKFSLLPELIYSQKGSIYDYDYNPSNPDTEAFNNRYEYIDALFRLSFAITPAFSLQAGPQLSLFLNSVRKSDSYGKEETGDGMDPKFLIGGNAGLRFRLNEAIGIVSRYAIDLQKTTAYREGHILFSNIRSFRLVWTISCAKAESKTGEEVPGT